MALAMAELASAFPTAGALLTGAPRRARLGLGAGRASAWNLGRAGVATAWGAVAWTAFVLVACTLANRTATALFGAVVAGMALLWRLAVRRAFRGPAVDLGQFERRA